MELGPNQTRWVEALRSGLYAQGFFSLRAGDAYCCLGVACEVFDVVAVKPIDSLETLYGDEECNCTAPRETREMHQLYGEVGEDLDGCNSLAGMNDNGKTFAEIADLLTARPERYFKEPR